MTTETQQVATSPNTLALDPTKLYEVLYNATSLVHRRTEERSKGIFCAKHFASIQILSGQWTREYSETEHYVEEVDEIGLEMHTLLSCATCDQNVKNGESEEENPFCEAAMYDRRGLSELAYLTRRRNERAKTFSDERWVTVEGPTRKQQPLRRSQRRTTFRRNEVAREKQGDSISHGTVRMRALGPLRKASMAAFELKYGAKFE